MKSEHDTPFDRQLGIMEIFTDPLKSTERLQYTKDFIEQYKSIKQLQSIKEFILVDYILNKIKNEREY